MNITTGMIKNLREATGAGPLDCKRALEAHAGDFDNAFAYLRERGLAKASRKAERETHAGLVVIKSSFNSTCAIELDCETDFVAFTDDFKALAHRIADQVLSDASLTDVKNVLTAPSNEASDRTTAELIQELVGRLDENIVLRQVVRYAMEAENLVEGYVHAGDLEGHYGPSEGRLCVIIDLRIADSAMANREMLRTLAHDLTLQIAANHPLYIAPEDIPEQVAYQHRQTFLEQLGQKPENIRAKILEGQMNKYHQDVCLLSQSYVKDDSLSVEQLLRQKSEEIGATVNISRFARLEIGA